eukprot:326040_1
MGICDSTQTQNEQSGELELVPEDPFTKRKKALDDILAVCKDEQQHWMDQINNFTCDETTKECIYIISYWARIYIEESSVLHPLVSSFESIITMNIILPYYEPETGLFGHSPRKQFDAQQLWAKKRLKWIKRRIRLVQGIKKELLKYTGDWRTNIDAKKYWKCELCDHRNIGDLYIKQKRDTLWNYQNEVAQYDREYAFNIIIYCKSFRMKHKLYLDYNLRKYQVIQRYVMHRCRMCKCNEDHVLKDDKKHRECDEC